MNAQLYIDRPRSRIMSKEGRFATTPRGYVFDRYLFQLLCLFVVVAAGIFVYVYGLGFDNNLYMNCPVNTPGGWCANPLRDPFNSYERAKIPLKLYEMPLLPVGFTYGRPPPSYSDFGIVVAFLVVVTFVINHFAYNGGLKEESY